MEENKTLREFLEKELGCKTKNNLEELKKSTDPFMLMMASYWKKKNEDAEEVFLFEAKRGSELIRTTDELIRKFYVRNSYIVIHQFPKNPARNNTSFQYIVEKEMEKKTVSITFEEKVTLITVRPGINV